MIKSHEKQIGEARYQTTTFPGRAGLRLQARVARALGPVLGGLLPAGKADSIMDLDVDIGGAIKGLASLDPDEFAKLAEDLLQSTRRNNQELKPEIIDGEFSGNYGELYQALAWVIDVNFGQLFGAGGIGGLAARAQEAMNRQKPPADSPTT